jgi:hypothetical protein
LHARPENSHRTPLVRDWIIFPKLYHDVTTLVLSSVDVAQVHNIRLQNPRRSTGTKLTDIRRRSAERSSYIESGGTCHSTTAQPRTVTVRRSPSPVKNNSFLVIVSVTSGTTLMPTLLLRRRRRRRHLVFIAHALRRQVKSQLVAYPHPPATISQFLCFRRFIPPAPRRMPSVVTVSSVAARDRHPHDSRHGSRRRRRRLGHVTLGRPTDRETL